MQSAGRPASLSTAEGDLESVEVISGVLELLASAPQPLGVTEVARELEISKARAYRHLRALVRRDYARQDPRTEGYEIGVRAVALGDNARERFGVFRAVRPLMNALQGASGLAVAVSARSGAEVALLEVLQGPRFIDFEVRPGCKLDPLGTAQGRIALSFGPLGLLESVVSTAVKAGDGRIADPDMLRGELERVRRQGWALVAGGAQVGVSALAAPVFDHRYVCRGAVALVGTNADLRSIPSEDQVGLVMSAAAQATASLGAGKA